MKLVRMVTGMLTVAMLMCSGNLCISASKQDGKILYSSMTVTLLIEMLKLVMMLSAIVLTETPPPARFVPIEAFYYAVPSFLYTIDNHLNYIILRFMDVTTLSVLWNLKIIVTAVLFRFVLKHPLSELRKIAIVLLVAGVLTTESNHLREIKGAMTTEPSNGSGSMPSMEDTAADQQNAHDLVSGVLLVFVGVTLSSCASVFTEWALKRKSKCPFLWQNMQMYVFGIIFNAVGVLVVEGQDIFSKGFFHDYSNWTLAVVAVNSISGIGMGFILKYLDNIACVYSHSMAMILTMLFSILFFSFSPSLEFGCGLTVLIISMYIYHHPLAHTEAISSMASPSTEQNRTSECTEKKQMKQHHDDVDDPDTTSSTITCDSSGSLSSMASKSISVCGLELKKTQIYSKLPVIKTEDNMATLM